MRGGMGITIRDVAAKAGVSISTVSRVLNNTCPVGDGKREHVEQAADELGYVPNPAARALLKRGTGGIGILLPYVGGEFFSEFLNGMDLTAKENGLLLVISTSHDEVAEWRAAVKALSRQVDGLLVMAPQLTPHELNLTAEVHTVFVNTAVEIRRASTVDDLNFDNEIGTYHAVRHLIDLGHRDLAYVRGPVGWFDATEREVGFSRAVRELGGSDAQVFVGDYHQEGGIRAVCQILKLSKRPTAIVATNDYCAMGVIAALREAGLSVPEDMSVVGFDDVPSARYVSPPLTTMRVPIRQIGVEAVQMLIKRVSGKDTAAPTHRNLAVELVVRGSTAQPRTM